MVLDETLVDTVQSRNGCPSFAFPAHRQKEGAKFMGIRVLHYAHETPTASAQFRVRVSRSFEQAALIVVNV